MNFSKIARSTFIGGLLRQPLRLIPSGMQVRILQGRSRGLRWIADSSTHGCWLGSYEWEKQRVFAALVKSGSVVYDIGANVGFYSLLASRLVGVGGLVVAFEPLPRNLEFLRTHISLNRLKNVTVVDAAVSDRNGEAAFEAEHSPSMGHLATSGRLRVRTLSLDHHLKATDCLAPDLLKIDVEGAEAAVLEGARESIQRHRPIIMLATHGDEIRQRCLAYLYSFDYKVTAMGVSVEMSDEFVATPPSR